MDNNTSSKPDGNHLFMVSTPLHLIVSIAIIDTQSIKNPHLIFIDQVQGKANPYLSVLQKWNGSPFKSINVFYRPVKKSFIKLADRKKNVFGFSRNY